MRVLFYCGVFARIGGIEEFTVDLAMALHEAGDNVGLVCAAPRHPALSRMEAAGISVRRVPVNKGCRWGIPNYALLPLGLRAMRDADVVIHQKPFNEAFYRLFPKGPKHVYITAYRPVEQYPSRTVRYKVFSHFDQVITQTASFASDIDDLGLAVPVEILPYIPPALQTVFNGKDEHTGILRIGMMGRLEPQKNPRYALEIVNHVDQLISGTQNRVVFNIYGAGTLEALMREESERVDVDVVFHGEYIRSEIGEIIDTNDLFLISSESEGQCIVALEILAGGRPLFATPVGALPDILKKPERGALLPVNDAVAAAGCIAQWWMSNRHDRATIQQSYLEDYDRSRIEAEYLRKLHAVTKAS